MAKCLFQSGGGGGKSKLKVVTAAANDVLKDKVIVDANGNPLTGTIESMGAQTITPSNVNKTVACNGKYMTGDITVKGDSNLVAANIISGVSIFGVAGNAQKLASRVFAITPGNASKPYSTNKGSVRFFHADINLGFHPIAYGFNGPGSSGSTFQNGQFQLSTGYDSSHLWYVNPDSSLISGYNLYLPVHTSNFSKEIDGCAAGYY